MPSSLFKNWGLGCSPVLLNLALETETVQVCVALEMFDSCASLAVHRHRVSLASLQAAVELFRCCFAVTGCRLVS